jgi:Subtilase family/Carboxypeptidase regulatory-like domain
MGFLISGRRLAPGLALLTCLLFLFSTGTAMAMGPDHSSSGLPQMQTPAPSGVVVVKMRPGPAADKTAAPDLLARSIAHLLPGAVVESRFQGLSKTLTDGELGRYFQIEAQKTDRAGLLKIVGTLNADPAVEVAFLEPVAVPASLGFDAFTGAVPAIGSSGMSKSAAETPDFEADQGYLNDAPLGVGALSMRAQSGALGTGLTVIDIEGGWLWSHEDLPVPAVEIGIQIDDLSWRNHGTAVLSEIRGQDNGLGVTGITPDCAVGCSSVGSASTAGALAAAVDALQPGDLILIELHAPGPNSYEGGGQFGYVPMEYWPDNFDIIRLATAKGIIVCEAAGNGYQYLDGPEYLGLFDRTLRDSGAIMCGATAGSDLYSADFSNHGSRVDLNGWGWSVTAAGYGDLQTGDETEWYTAQFSGTSSASPIVTGSVTSLQGMVRESLGFDLDARLARDILRVTGTLMESGHEIGTRPNLVAAYAHADTIVGEISGTVAHQDTGVPISGVLVQVSGNGSFTMTDDNGVWRLPLVLGPVNLEFSSYFFHPATAGATILAGQTVTLNQFLIPLDLIDITGTVYGASGALPGVVVTPTDQPVWGDVSDALGNFRLTSVPAAYDYTLLFDGAVGYGAQIEIVSTSGLLEDAEIATELAVVTEDFAPDNGGFVPQSDLWTHGIPPFEVTGGAFVSGLCWGIGMDGEYGDDQADTLFSPVYNLSGVSDGDYFLSFHYYSATEPGFDGVNLEVWENDQFILLEPREGYTDPGLGGLGGSAGWSGNSGRWQGTVFDISSHTNADFRFRLNFGSDAGVFEQGFYIDGIAFSDGQRVSAVTDNEAPSPVEARLKAWPNPFNPQVNIEFAVTRPGHLHVDVFDVRGNRVRTLLDAPVAETTGTLNWDGRRDDGRTLPSGIYLVRLIGPDNQVTSQRVVLAK